MLIVPRKDKKIDFPSIILTVFAVAVIYSMLFPIILLDIWTYIYQEIYFGILKIPTVNRSEYVILERHKYASLNFSQKLSCFYCDYVHGILRWAKQVANNTEIYSCAVKHTTKSAQEDFQEGYYELK